MEHVVQQTTGPSEEQIQVLSEFLAWLEKSQQLVLCQVFRPQFDWYMPAFADKKKLARAYLVQKRPLDRDKRDQRALVRTDADPQT